jgi:hypothetical protein
VSTDRHPHAQRHAPQHDARGLDYARLGRNIGRGIRAAPSMCGDVE